MSAPQKLTVAPPDTAAPSPVPADLADRLDRLAIDDTDTFWTAARLVEYAFRLGYADGHARGYRDRDREFVAESRVQPSIADTQTVRAIKGQ